MTEAELRRRVVQELGSRAVRIEPAMGSSQGLPDLMVYLGGGAVAMVELKRRGCSLRPGQAAFARRATSHRVPYITLRPGHQSDLELYSFSRLTRYPIAWGQILEGLRGLAQV